MFLTKHAFIRQQSALVKGIFAESTPSLPEKSSGVPDFPSAIVKLLIFSSFLLDKLLAVLPGVVQVIQ